MSWNILDTSSSSTNYIYSGDSYYTHASIQRPRKKFVINKKTKSREDKKPQSVIEEPIIDEGEEFLFDVNDLSL
jgi:hypothetical protein